MKLLTIAALGLAGLFMIAYVLGAGMGAVAMAIIAGGLGMLGIFK